MAIQFPPIVAVDSMTLVWGLRNIGSEDQCRNAGWLLDQFTRRKTQVILPSVALSEYLTAFDPAQHEAVRETLGKRFLFRDFTDDCAPLAAKLFRSGSKMRVKNDPGGRAVLRADCLIVATAHISGAACLFSNDSGVLALADTITKGFGQDIPEPPKDMFGHVLSD
jgi:hypothetical protein